MISAFASTWPDRIAVSTETGSLTWAAFAARVEERRDWLRSKGLVAGTRLLLEGSASVALVATVVACLIDGVVFILLDETLPEQRKAIMVRESAPDVRAVAEDDAGLPPATASLSLPCHSLAENVPAYIFFTSGTTGIPKAVLGSGSGLIHFLSWERDTLGVGAGDRIACLTGLSFDVILRDMLLPLVSGATLCLPPRDLPRDGRSVFDWLERAGVTILHAVPSLAGAWLGASDAIASDAPLRHCLFAGEPLSETLVAGWRKRFSGTRIHNLYGPTETTLAKVHHEIPAIPELGIQPCGRPLPEVTILVLNETGTPCPEGTIGEIAIRTRHASLGYLNAPEEDATRFRRQSTETTYLTGDLGRIDDTGNLRLVGRTDFQIKINGVRIEPEGIAADLETHPAIRAAAVVGRRTERETYALEAFYVATGTDDLSDGLRRYLSARLPAVMVPQNFTRLDALPLTANGKLDRSRLPQRSIAEPGEGAETPAEQVLIDIWRTVLDVEGVGATDNFFALGGDSLAAVEIAIRIEEHFSRRIPPAMFIDAPTPRAMSRLIADGAGLIATSIPETDAHGTHPLSPQQRRYFRTFCAGGDQSWCNMVAVFPLPPATTRDAVEQALNLIVRRHESLRIRFSRRPGCEPVQIFSERMPIDLHETDLSGLDPATRTAVFEALRLAEAARPIPLDTVPLFRATMIRFDADDLRLLWNVHHMISDGTSQGLLRTELEEILCAGCENRTPVLPAIGTRFRDWAAWGNAGKRSDSYRAARAHWLNQHDRGDHDFRLAYRRSIADPQRCHAFSFTLADPTRAAVHRIARSARTTPFIVLLSGTYLLLHAATGRDDLVVASPLAGRIERTIEASIGNYINLITTRSRRGENRTCAHLLEDLHRQIGLAARHQAFQFDDLVEALGLRFDPDRNPLTPFSLNFMPQTVAHGPASPPSSRDMGYTLRYDLLFLVRDHPDRTAVEIQYRAGAFTRDDIVALSSAWENLLAGLDAGVGLSAALRGVDPRLAIDLEDPAPMRLAFERSRP